MSVSGMQALSLHRKNFRASSVALGSEGKRDDERALHMNRSAVHSPEPNGSGLGAAVHPFSSLQKVHCIQSALH